MGRYGSWHWHLEAADLSELKTRITVTSLATDWIKSAGDRQKNRPPCLSSVMVPPWMSGPRLSNVLGLMARVVLLRRGAGAWVLPLEFCVTQNTRFYMSGYLCPSSYGGRDWKISTVYDRNPFQTFQGRKNRKHFIHVKVDDRAESQSPIHSTCQINQINHE